jgi:hypothetical protein
MNKEKLDYPIKRGGGGKEDDEAIGKHYMHGQGCLTHARGRSVGQSVTARMGHKIIGLTAFGNYIDYVANRDWKHAPIQSTGTIDKRVNGIGNTPENVTEAC